MFGAERGRACSSVSTIPCLQPDVERRDAADDAFAEGLRSLTPRNDSVVGRAIALGCGNDIIGVLFRIEIAHDICPFSGRRQSDGTGSFADGEAIDGRDLDRVIRQRAQTVRNSTEKHVPGRFGTCVLSFARDADEHCNVVAAHCRISRTI